MGQSFKHSRECIVTAFILFHMLRKTRISTCLGQSWLLSLIAIRPAAEKTRSADTVRHHMDTKITVCQAKFVFSVLTPSSSMKFDGSICLKIILLLDKYIISTAALSCSRECSGGQLSFFI